MRPQGNLLLPLAFPDCPFSGLLIQDSCSSSFIHSCRMPTAHTPSVRQHPASALVDDKQEALSTPTSNLQTLSWGRGTGKESQWPQRVVPESREPRKDFDKESQRPSQSLWVFHNNRSQVITVSRPCCHEPWDQGMCTTTPSSTRFQYKASTQTLLVTYHAPGPTRQASKSHP